MFNIIISFIPWSIYSWVINGNVLTLVERSLILTVLLSFILLMMCCVMSLEKAWGHEESPFSTLSLEQVPLSQGFYNLN